VAGNVVEFDGNLGLVIGAGGGSLIWIDDGGLLRAGPESAGADPGPACYGRGGDRPTITDCHLVRGTIRAETFLGGQMKLDEAAARRVLQPVADALGLTQEQAADAAIQVAEANIVRAIQRISTERGHDPREYALVPFGGAGPMLACRIAEELGIGQVIVCPAAGVMSAYGLLASDFVHFESRTRQLRLIESEADTVSTTIEELTAAATGHLNALGLGGAISTSVSLDMRYVGQAFEIAVDLPNSAGSSIAEIAERFAEAHHRIFEFDKAGGAAVEIVAFRVRASASPGEPPELSAGADDAKPVPHAFFERGSRQEGVCQGRPAIGSRVEGPVLIEDGTSTLLVAKGWAGTVDEAGNLVLRKT